MKTLQEIYDALDEIYMETLASEPWVDYLIDARQALECAISYQRSFDPVDHARNLRDGAIEDAAIADWKEQ